MREGLWMIIKWRNWHCILYMMVVYIDYTLYRTCFLWLHIKIIPTQCAISVVPQHYTFSNFFWGVYIQLIANWQAENWFTGHCRWELFGSSTNSCFENVLLNPRDLFCLILIYEKRARSVCDKQVFCCSLATQISHVSTHSLTSRTCRRSPSTLLWSMLMLQASKNLHLLSPPGKTNYQRCKWLKTIIYPNFTKLVCANFLPPKVSNNTILALLLWCDISSEAAASMREGSSFLLYY